MNISTIIAKALGVILLIVWLVFLPAGRICFRQLREMLFWEPTDNLNEKLKLWLEKASNFQKLTVPIIYRAIIRTWHALSTGRDGLLKEVGQAKDERIDNFTNRVSYSMYIITFRWHILPFVVGVGLILSGSLWLILVLPAVWILSLLPFFPYLSAMFLLVIGCGWIYGGLLFSYFDSTSKLWYWASRAMGVVFMSTAYIIIMAIVGWHKVLRRMEANEQFRGDSE